MRINKSRSTVNDGPDDHDGDTKARLDDGAARDAVAAASTEDLFRSEAMRLSHYFYGHTRQKEDAHDLVQETFARFTHAARRIVIDRPEAYLQRIAGNLLRDRAASNAVRLQSRHASIEEEHVAAPQDQHRSLEAREMLSLYEAALLRLKPKTREIFLLHRLDGLSYSEIASRFGMSQSGVKKHMVKAIACIDRARRGL